MIIHQNICALRVAENIIKCYLHINCAHAPRGGQQKRTPHEVSALARKWPFSNGVCRAPCIDSSEHKRRARLSVLTSSGALLLHSTPHPALLWHRLNVVIVCCSWYREFGGRDARVSVFSDRFGIFYSFTMTKTKPILDMADAHRSGRLYHGKRRSCTAKTIPHSNESACGVTVQDDHIAHAKSSSSRCRALVQCVCLTQYKFT